MSELLPQNWLPALLVFLTVGFGVAALAFLGESLREVRRRRDFRKQLRSVTGQGTPEQVQGVSLLRDERQPDTVLDSVVSIFPQGRDLRLRLEQADLDWSPGTFITVCFGLAIAFGATSLVLTPYAVTAGLAAVFGFALPFLQLRRLKKKRIRAFEEQLPEAIDLLGRSIRAGHAFPTGLKVVSEESPDPLGAEFRQIFEEQKFGLPLEDSLMGLTDRIDLVDIKIFVTAILVQREVGGNLAEILDKIAYTIRERFMLLRQVRVYTAQGRLTGYILAALPILLGLAIAALNPTYMGILFEEPTGRILIVMAATLQFVGFLVIRRIIDIEI